MTEQSPDVIDRQLEAYNARDLEGFVACYAPGVQLCDGNGDVMAEGRDGLRHLYAVLFENSIELHCDVTNRIQVGPFTIDEEHVRGVQFEGLPEAYRAAVVYRVAADGLIDRVVAMLDA